LLSSVFGDYFVRYLEVILSFEEENNAALSRNQFQPVSITARLIQTPPAENFWS